MDEEITHSLVYAVGTEHYGLGRSQTIQMWPAAAWNPGVPADKILASLRQRSNLSIMDIYHQLRWKPISTGMMRFSLFLDAVKVGLRGCPHSIRGEIVRLMFMIPVYPHHPRGYKHRSVRRIEHRELRFTPTSRLYVEERNWPRFCAEAGEEAVVTAQGGRFHVVDGQGSTWEFGPHLC